MWASPPGVSLPVLSAAPLVLVITVQPNDLVEILGEIIKEMNMIVFEVDKCISPFQFI